MEVEFSNVGVLGTKSFNNFLHLFERRQFWEILQLLQRHPWHQKNFQKSLWERNTNFNNLSDFTNKHTDNKSHHKRRMKRKERTKGGGFRRLSGCDLTKTPSTNPEVSLFLSISTWWAIKWRLMLSFFTPSHSLFSFPLILISQRPSHFL